MLNFLKRFKVTRLPATLVIILLLLTGWEKNTESGSVLQLVSTSGNNYVFSNRSLPAGTPVTTGVFARTINETKTLQKFKTNLSDSSNKDKPAVYLDSTLKPGTQVFSMPVTYTPRNILGYEFWNFTVVDNTGKEYSQTIRLRTAPAANDLKKSPFYTFPKVLLSRVKINGKDSLGHVSFAAADGTTFPNYVIKQAAVADKIDLTLNSSVTNKPNLYSGALNASTLQTTSLKPENFNSITSAKALQDSYPKTAGQTSLGPLVPDQVIAFKSKAGKVGLLHVTTVYKTRDSLAFNVKVEK